MRVGVREEGKAGNWKAWAGGKRERERGREGRSIGDDDFEKNDSGEESGWRRGPGQLIKSACGSGEKNLDIFQCRVQLIKSHLQKICM